MSSWPQVYAKWRASRVGEITDRLERALILELLGDVAGREVLDVGCGDGDLGLVLWERRARVAGIDASPAMIDAARARAGARGADIDFRLAEAERLPFPDGRFDCVAAITVLCFVKNPAAIFREMGRVLRPGGRLVIGELGRWNSWAAARRIRGWLGSRIWRDAQFHTEGELRALAEQAGLAAEAIRGAVFYPRCMALARLMAPLDPWIGRRTTMGAAFLALCAVKPG